MHRTRPRVRHGLCLTLAAATATAALADPSWASAQGAPAAAPASAVGPGAGEAPTLHWDPAWPRVRDWQYVLTLGLLGAQLFVEIGAVRSGSEPRFRGPWLGEGGFQEAVRIEDVGLREEVDEVSFVVWQLTQLFPVYADIGIASLAVHQNSDVAWQLFAISAQVMLSVSILTRVVHLTVRRQRPIFYHAEREGSDSKVSSARTLSFWSGHAAMSFAAAGLTCAFHEHLPLFGGGLGDTLACAGTLAGASTVAVTRLLTDRHYLTDTLVGSAVGLLAGYYLPQLLHFEAGDSLTLAPFGDDADLGLALQGRF